MKDCALICDHKVVIKIPCGANIANMILVLMAFCHTFNLEYSQEEEDVMELLAARQVAGIVRKEKTWSSLQQLIQIHHMSTRQDFE